MRHAPHNSRSPHQAALVLTVLAACLVTLYGGPGVASAQTSRKTPPPKVTTARPRAATTTETPAARPNLQPLREFFARLKKRVAGGEVNPQQEFSLTVQTVRQRDEWAAWRWLNFNGDAAAKTALQDFLAAFKATQVLESFAPNAQTLTLELVAGKTDLLIKAAFEVQNAQRAQALAADYGKLFATLTTARRATPEGVLWENTQARTELRQVIVVSRLPRAALNAELAAQRR